MSISRLFSRLDESGIRLQLQDDQLKIHAPKGKLTPALVNELKDKKDEIIVFLKKHVQKPEKYEPIVSVEKKEYYPVSSAQKRLYILYRLNKESTVYNMPSVLELKSEEEWDRQSIEDTFRCLVRRHESFRTSFEIINEEPVQRIEAPFGQVSDAFGGSDNEGTRGLAPLSLDPATHSPQPVTALISAFIRPFDLSRAPLLRVGMISIEKEKHMLLVDMHHIISDGMSIEILIKEFMGLRQKEAGNTLPSLKLQYKDYSEWQHQRNEKEQVAVKQQAYWLKEFAGERLIMSLPYDYPRPAIQSFEGETITFEFQNKEVCALNHLVQEENVTLFMILLAVFNILLGKLSEQEDIVVGTPVAGRIHPDLEPVIGMFVNTLALRNYPHGEKTFTGFLSEVKTGSLKAFENQDYPFEALVEKVTAARDAGRNPLFDIMFALHNIRDNAGDQGKPGTYAYENRVSRFDMTWMGTERGERIDFEIEYCTKLYKREAIERFFTYFKKIVTAVTEEPGITISRIEIISAAEREQVLYDFNDTKTEYPQDKTIHTLFKEQAEKTPDHIAIVGPSVSVGVIVRAINQSPLHQITNKELNENANQLVHLLIEKGIGPDTIVGIKMGRSIEMIIGLLGILKAGGAYLPIDPNYPGERIDFMLKDSGAKVLLTGNLDLPPSTLPPFYPSNPSSLAYIIYTSGSTGRPKGVLVQHQNVVSRVKNSNFIDFTADDRVLPTGNIVFDITAFEIWWPLLNGLTLFLANQPVILNAQELENFLVKNCISILHLTPQLFNQLAAQRLEIFSRLRYFLVGGDLVTPHYVNLLRNTYKDIKILHMYGPTENTIFSTFHLVTRNYDTVIPIGKPLGNSFVYIADKAGNLVPIGVPGELLTGGDGTARGYLNNPGLTAEKFYHQQPGGTLFEGTGGLAPLLNKEPGKRVYGKENLKETVHLSYKLYPRPYAPGPRLYLTGDLARWLPDGNIEFLGRIDTQVKIRGFRVETGEIESCLLDIDYIKEAVVIAKDDNTGGKYLCAYVVSGQEVSSAGLKNILAKNLPDYMLPSYFTQIKQIPLTANGKIDMKALPEPQWDKGKNYVAPKNNIHMKLVELWSEILGTEKDIIGIDSNFFELGGQSLKATILITKIHRYFNVKLSLAEMFKQPTIRGLAEYIKEAKKEEYTSIKLLEKKEYYPLSSPQKRLYILQQMDLKSTVYHISHGMELNTGDNRSKLEEIFSQLIRRHESFRTSFLTVNEEPVQRIEEEVEIKVEVNDYEGTRGLAPLPDEPATVLISSFIRPFDLSKAPLLRVGLIRLEKKKPILLLDMHHIISDGTSMKVLIEEFQTQIARRELPALRIQYKDYARWQASSEIREWIDDQEKHWIKEFSNEIPVLNLALDYLRPGIQSFEGSTVGFELGTEATAGLKVLALEQGTTLFMILIAIFNVLLRKLSSQEDIVIGTPTAGRRHADLQQIIGMFVNTLALRNYPLGAKTFIEFLSEVKYRTLEAFENQDYPFEDLVEKTAVIRDASRNPLFDVMFSLQNIQEEPGTGMKPGTYTYEAGVSRFDMTWIGTERGNKLGFEIEYCCKLFKNKTIERLIDFFKNIVTAVIAEPHRKISQIEVISEHERKQVLYDFNDTAGEYPVNKTIHELFAEQVQRTPDHIALVGPIVSLGMIVRAINQSPLHQITSRSEGTRGLAPLSGLISITYKELNEHSHQLARLLIQTGVTPDTIVGIRVERSIEMIIGILGILKASGAYLPIDPDYPQERIQYMLKDSDVRILLKGNTLGGKKSEIRNPKSETNPNDPNLNDQNKRAEVTVLDFEQLKFEFVSSFEFRASNLNPSNLAYIIYTSGSTGKPKGTMIDHHSVVNILFHLEQLYPLGEKGTFLLKTTYTFDVSVTELFGWFFGAGRLAVLARDAQKDPVEILEAIQRYQVTHINFVPALFYAFVESLTPQRVTQLSTLRYIFLAGEELLPPSVKRFRSLDSRIALENIYGPTEATIYAAKYSLPDGEETDKIPIGKPLANVKVYIFDKTNRIQPIGIPGELGISGEGTARGYLNNPELTAEKFDLRVSTMQLSHQHSPHSPITPFPHSPIYHTGDLARWLPDGNIEFLGRIDTQVKIRGFRIELGEIENQLLTHEAITEAVVVPGEDRSGDKYLCAYVVFASTANQTPQGADLKEYLTPKLPEYMIPSYFVLLETLPKSPTGKIDRKALPAPGIKLAGDYATPRNEIEQKLVEIWTGVLGRIPGINDNFFALGGHSLKATIMVSKIHKEMEVEVPLQEIFKSPTIRSLAIFISTAANERFVPMELVEKKEYYPLSHNQNRLWIIQQLDPGSSSYHISGIIPLNHHVDVNAVKKTLSTLFTRHESLRTGFKKVEINNCTKPIQFIRESLEIPFKVIDLSTLDEGEKRQKQAAVIKEINTMPFDLGTPPLFRSMLIKQGEDKFIFVYNMHHIVTDGWSMEVLRRDFSHLYETYTIGKEADPGPMVFQYKDFAAWHNRQIQDAAYREMVHRYWKKVIEPGLPALKLPFYYSGSQEDKSGAGYRCVVEQNIKDKLRQLAADNHTTLFTVMFSLYNLLFAYLSGQTDIVTTIISAGRKHPSLYTIVGYFINPVIVKIHVDLDRDFNDLLSGVNRQVLEAFQNQDYPFELAAADLKITYPAVTTAFNFLNMQDISTEMELDTLEPYHIGKKQEVKFQLVLFLTEYKNGIEINWDYQKTLFKPETIEYIAGKYLDLLKEAGE